MKSNLLCTCTVGFFLVCALYTIWMAASYLSFNNDLQMIAREYAEVEQTRGALNSLAGEALEYSKKNPAIDPILQKFELKPKPGSTNAPVRPAATTPTKQP